MEFINRVQGWNQDEFESFLRELETVLVGLPVRGNTTPVPTPATGSLTSASADVRYTRTLDRCIYTVTVTITTNGTGAGYIAVPMPYTAAESTGASGIIGGAATALAGVINAMELRIFNYDGTYPGSDGAVLRMSGNYRISR